VTSLLRRALGGGKRDIVTLEDYATILNSFQYQGNTYAPSVTQSYGNPQLVEQVRPDFASYCTALYANNGIVFALMAVRQLAFSQIRMQWQTLNKGRPGDLYSTPDLAQFEKPWDGGTTQDLLAKMITDADLAGNSYWTITGGEMVRLRPDWVDIVLAPRDVAVPRNDGNMGMGTLGLKKVGYLYWEGGRGVSKDPVPLLPDEVAHFAPLTDPLATYRGMSWLTPLLRELATDRAMVEHQNQFFQRAATPNMVVKHDPQVSVEDAKRFKLAFDTEYGGVHNAWKTMHLGGGADVTVVGADFKQMDFKLIQGHGETRIAAAAGVPPIIPGFSEGLASATYSNYGQALRRFSGLTLHPLWKSAAGSLQTLLKGHPGSRLWYDTRDVEFLREDAQDLAEVQQTQAATVSSYISAGFTPESAVQAVRDDDLAVLEHTGLVSVQLWVPGAQTDPASAVPAGSTGSTKTKKTGNGGGTEPDSTPPQAQGAK
jgi:hypothetical protein